MTKITLFLLGLLLGAAFADATYPVRHEAACSTDAECEGSQ